MLHTEGQLPDDVVSLFSNVFEVGKAEDDVSFISDLLCKSKEAGSGLVVQLSD